MNWHDPVERPIRVGIVGAGFAADFHLESYQRVHGLNVRVIGIASRTRSKAEWLAERYGIERVYPDFAALIEAPHIEAVDLCTPVHVHKEQMIAAARAGKHVICEKPLIGFVGDGDTSRSEMYQQVQNDLSEIEAAFRESKTQLFYAENWIYAPPIQRGLELVRASGGTILEIRGNEAHSGSASPFSLRWRTSGGGALLRLGIHPLSAAIFFKRDEGVRRYGSPIQVADVYGCVADLTKVPAFVQEDKHWLVTGWKDVENWAIGILTFEDGTMAVITASDVALGGIENSLDLYLSNARVRCNIDPNTTLQAYAPDATIFKNVFLSEKLETCAGWSYPVVDHSWMSGHNQAIQDFMEALAYGREPASGLDFAVDCIDVAYALYLSAAEGRRLKMKELHQ